MSTWTRHGKDTEAWANRPYWRRRRYWRRATEGEFLAARAVEQAEIRRTFMIDNNIPTRGTHA